MQGISGLSWLRHDKLKHIGLLCGADSLKLLGLVMVGFQALSTDETNGLLRYGIGVPLEGKLLAAVTTRNAEIPATFDPLNEHWGIESNTDNGVAGRANQRRKDLSQHSAVPLQRPF